MESSICNDPDADLKAFQILQEADLNSPPPSENLCHIGKSRIVGGVGIVGRGGTPFLKSVREEVNYAF